MSMMLSAASCLDWVAKLTGPSNVPALIAATQQADKSAEPVWFLPYPSGERTPHNNPQARGVFFGLTHQHGPNELARAVLGGVGYVLVDGMDVMHAYSIKPQNVTLIGGGVRSEYQRQVLTDISDQQLNYHTEGGVRSALGATRLAQITANPEKSLVELLPQLPLERSHLPDARHYIAYQPRRKTLRRLYQQLLSLVA